MTRSTRVLDWTLIFPYNMASKFLHCLITEMVYLNKFLKAIANDSCPSLQDPLRTYEANHQGDLFKFDGGVQWFWPPYRE